MYKWSDEAGRLGRHNMEKTGFSVVTELNQDGRYHRIRPGALMKETGFEEGYGATWPHLSPGAPSGVSQGLFLGCALFHSWEQDRGGPLGSLEGMWQSHPEHREPDCLFSLAASCSFVVFVD